MSEFGACSRWAEVEVATDGRLAPREVERAQRHVAHCAQCRADQARWEAHRVEARQFARLPVSELHRRRASAALLRAAVAGDETARRPLRAFVWVGLALAAAALVRVGVGRQRAPARPEVPTARVEPVGTARWARVVTPTQETVRLDEGSLHVSVPHQRPGHRFVVALPDGELEVRGTRFLVETDRGHTRRVTVFEGLVALRVIDGAEQLIAAGGRWQAPRAPTRPAVDPRRVAAPPPPSSATAPRPSPRSEGPSPFGRFAEGVEAMGRGDFRAAATAFERFERESPRDERADDAAWLRVVSLRRSGEFARAQDGAGRYLETYRSGAHRVEAATLRAQEAFLSGDCARVTALAASEGGTAGGDELRRLRDRCAREAGAP